MTVWTPTDDGHADLSSHDAFVNGAPHNTFARLRRDDPVTWCDWPNGRGFWSVTRHADILTLNRDHALISSAQGIRMEDQTPEEYLARRTFQETDPPEHTRVRMLVTRAFSKAAIARFEEQIAQMSVEIVDQAAQQTEFDAVKAIARQLPMRMLGRILGTPDSDLPWLVEKGDELIANSDPEFTEHVLDQSDTDAFRLMPFRSPAGLELYDYARKLMADKERSGDTDGILHLVLQRDDDGNTITEAEFRNFFCLLVAAGNDTTRYTIAGAIHAMANQPGLMETLARADKTTLDLAADEFVRWASPAMHFRRTVTRDFEMHGKKLSEGDKILLWFVSGNFDEQAFEKPFEVNPTRKPNRHLGFGQGGPHLCLGMWLARLEIRVVLQALVARFSKIEQTGDHAFVRSNFLGGIKQLPVRATSR
jgi:cytochrome P450